MKFIHFLYADWLRQEVVIALRCVIRPGQETPNISSDVPHVCVYFQIKVRKCVVHDGCHSKQMAKNDLVLFFCCSRLSLAFSCTPWVGTKTLKLIVIYHNFDITRSETRDHIQIVENRKIVKPKLL